MDRVEIRSTLHLQQYLDEKTEDEDEAPYLITSNWKQSSLQLAVSEDGLRLTALIGVVSADSRRDIVIQLDLDRFFQSVRGRASWKWSAVVEADRKKASESLHMMIRDPNLKKLLFGVDSSSHSSLYHWYESAPTSLHEVNDLLTDLRPDDQQKSRLWQEDLKMNGFSFGNSASSLFKFVSFSSFSLFLLCLTNGKKKDDKEDECICGEPRGKCAADQVFEEEKVD